MSFNSITFDIFDLPFGAGRFDIFDNNQAFIPPVPPDVSYLITEAGEFLLTESGEYLITNP